MGRLLHLGALACLYLGAESKALRWQDDTPSWSPPKETIAAMDMEKLGFSPAPTAAPDPANVELKLAKRVRGDDTCGYISGISTNSIYCGVGSCVINSFRSVVGCCTESAVSNCNIMTTCVPSSSSALYRSTDTLMEFCAFSTAPECVTYVYTGSLFNDYTLYACNTAKASIVVYANPLDSTTDDPIITSFPVDEPTTLPSISTTRTITPGPATSTGGGGGGGGGSSAPIGAIVGGVVGGLALIAIIILGVVFLLRKKKKDGQNNGNQAPPAMYDPQQQGGPQTGAPPQMYQTQPTSPGGYAPSTPGGFPPGFAPVDNRQSMLKQSYDVTTGPYDQNGNGISPSVSPPPVSPSPTYQSGIPGYVPSQVSGNSPTQGGYPLPQQPYQQQQQTYQQQQQQPTPYHTAHSHQPQTSTTTTTHHSHHQSFASELPATRGDNELRELA